MCKTPLIIWNRERNYRKTTGSLVETALDTSDLDAIFDHSQPVPRRDAIPSVSAVEDHGLPFRVVPCGKCVDCAKSKRSGWYVRARRQIECGRYRAVYWVLWTWKDSTIPTTKEELSASIRAYKDRMRKKYGYTPDHFMVTERGEDDRFTHRLHMHGFLCFKQSPPSFESIKNDWSKEGFLFVRKLGVLPDGRHISPMAAVTYSMKYMFKSFMYRIGGDKLSGCIYASLGFGLAQFSSRSFRLKLHEDPTYRLTETFDGLFRYSLPRYLSERVYLNEGGRPIIDLNTLIAQLVGEPPPGRSLADHLRYKLADIKQAYECNFSYSRRFADYRKAISVLLLKYSLNG